MRKTFNFSAGPAVLPEQVLQEAADEMMNYKGSDMSVMEISHRSALFQSIIDETEADLRKLMTIPDDYEVLFLQGGTSLQFAMIPMNFMRNRKADFILTGYWAKTVSYTHLDVYKRQELIQIASNPAFEENRKEKHSKNTKYGWYRYDVRFALPVYEENILVRYNIFYARLLVNHAENGRKYLYDILAIKKETSKP